jgi:hypothetical protein
MAAKTFRVYYTYPNDSTEYCARIQATDDNAADRQFRTGLSDDEMWNCTVTRIVEQTIA